MLLSVKSDGLLQRQETGNLRRKCSILGRQLRADGIKVSVFRQQAQGGQWVDAPVAPATASEIENKVLARARELRSAATGS